MPTAKTADLAYDPSNVEFVSPDDLWFDEHNPRLQGVGGESTQGAILHQLWRDFAVDEVALSIAENGFFPYEPLFVATERGKRVVIEGNRRLAAVRLLRDAALRRQLRVELPTPSGVVKRSLESIPIVPCERAEIWQYVGFKHVNGPQVWDALSKAMYVAWVHNDLQVPLPEVAKRIGDQHSTVQRLYTGLMALGQAERTGVWTREDRFNKRFAFSHLYTGLTLSGIRGFLGISDARAKQVSSTPVPKKKEGELGELCVWLYGSKSANRPPLVKTQNPDLRKLDEVLAAPNGVAALRRHLPLDLSLDISRGDDRILREALVASKAEMQSARARVPTGYAGEADMYGLAVEIKQLADSVVDDMQRMNARPRL